MVLLLDHAELCIVESLNVLDWLDPLLDNVLSELDRTHRDLAIVLNVLLYLGHALVVDKREILGEIIEILGEHSAHCNKSRSLVSGHKHLRRF